ncbi:hypothetical protein YC2023_119149 [Brassica napus]
MLRFDMICGDLRINMWFFSPIWVRCEFDHEASDHDISLIITFCYLHISLLLISLLSPQLSKSFREI